MANKTNAKRKVQEEVVAIIAEKHGTTARWVQMVISGDGDNEEILTDYLSYKEKHNKLLEEVKRLVPFNN